MSKPDVSQTTAKVFLFLGAFLIIATAPAPPTQTVTAYINEDAFQHHGGFRLLIDATPDGLLLECRTYTKQRDADDVVCEGHFVHE